MEAVTEKASTPHYDRWERLRREAVWTSEMRDFAKKANHVVLYFTPVPDAPAWHRDAAFVELKFVKEAKLGHRTEETMSATFTGHVSAGHRDDLYKVQSEFGEGWVRYSEESENLYRPTGGTWLLHLFPNQGTHAHSCLMALAVNSTLQFRVLLDYHSSPVLAESRLHGDVLTVTAEKGKRKPTFTLDTHTCRHNSARFGFMT